MTGEEDFRAWSRMIAALFLGAGVGLLLGRWAGDASLWPGIGLLAVGGIACLFGPKTQPIGPLQPTADIREGLAAVSTEALSAAVPDPLLVIDAGGFLLHANPAAHAEFGALASGLSVPLRFRAPEMQALVASLLSGDVERGEAEFSERLPLDRTFHVAAARLDDNFFALTFRELGEARRIDRMRADFVANASHELRTPLASIAGFVETLRGPARDDVRAREKFLDIIQEQTARMSRLIDDLLSLSRLESRPYLDLGQPVDLGAVIRNVTSALAPLAEQSGIVIETELGPDSIEVGGSRDELFQVVENLIENACRYGAEGKRVLVTLGRNTAGEPEFAVRDWGGGIAPEHLPRITERFYRADPQSSRTRRGTGLGLAIVKHIATRHHARLGVESALGQGSTFTLRFPAR